MRITTGCRQGNELVVYGEWGIHRAEMPFWPNDHDSYEGSREKAISWVVSELERLMINEKITKEHNEQLRKIPTC